MKIILEKLLRSRPLVWLACAFIVGLLVASATGFAFYAAPIFLAAGLALLVWRRTPVLAGVLLVGLSLGLLRYGVYCVRSADDVSRWIGPAPVTLIGTIAADPIRRPGRTTLLLDAQEIDMSNGPEHVTGTAYVSVYAYAYETGPRLAEGNRVALDGILHSPQGATNPGGFSWQEYLARRAVYCEMRVKRTGGVRVLAHAGGNPWLLTASRARDALLRSMQAGLSKADAAVLSGILMGQRADLPPALMADFVATGTVHILATAGLHVGIISMILMGLFARITLPRKLAAALMIGTLWLYALMAGGRPSVTRAAFMASVYFAAILFGRAPDLLTSLAAAALVVLWLQPTAILEPAFQMSFVTVLGIILLMPIWMDIWSAGTKRFSSPSQRWIFHRVVELVGLSFIAQLAAAPVVAQAYNQFSVLGFFANLCVVPALFVLLPAGFLASLLGLASPTAAGILFKTVVAPVLHYIEGAVTLFAGLPGCSFSIQTLPTLAILTYYGLLYGGIVAGKAWVSRHHGSSDQDDSGAAPTASLTAQYEND